MPDANALTYLQLQDAVLGRRFPASTQRTNSKRWLASAYSDVWTAPRADDRMWSFELMFLVDLAITAGDSTPTMPADYGDTIELRDADGAELKRLDAADFARQFAALTTSESPWAFTVVGRVVHIGPTPGANATFKHTYRRRLSHRESDYTTVTGGFMDEDSDYPLWDDHQSILIPRATAIGLQELNDPTWEQAQEEYERQLSRMRADLDYVLPQTGWPSYPGW